MHSSSKEAFFQMTLRRFGVMPRLPLSTPIPVLPLIRTALDLPEAAWTESDGDKDDLAEVRGNTSGGRWDGPWRQR